MKMDPPVACLLQTLLLMVLLPPAASVRCPRRCSCPQPAELHCTFRSLIAIPAAGSSVERMNLGFNSISKVTDKSLAGLRKLELLMIHGNDIHSLPDGVFRDLTALQMLKMSYNKLKEISRDTLQGLWALARLHLDHNRLEVIHPEAFQGLTSLRMLQLEGNRLQQLHPATFSTFTLMGHFHVSTLRHLYLSDNGLTSIPSRLLAIMPQLETLYLHGNPWTCDCNMGWLHGWNKTSPGVLKCKKDRALPGGQLCPVCSFPRHHQGEELQSMENLICSSPIISSPDRTSPPNDGESEVMTKEDFSEAFGNISLGLSDEHGNEVDLVCNISEPRELTKITWQQVNQLHLATNITLTVDLECPVDRDKYERLWRLIAYYSNVPAHLQRGIMLRKEPHPAYVYRQDSEKDALYYTGIKVNMMAQPAWMMQTSADLQLNRLESSAKMVKLILSTDFTETVDTELVQRQRRTWVMIESINTTRKVFSATLGSPRQMHCNVQSSGPAVIHWMLPDGSKVEAPYHSPDNRVSVSSNGLLVIKAASHTDTGIYYCIAKVHGDHAVLPFHLAVLESSSPPPGEDTSIVPIEGFAGNPISIPCTASGSPDAEINWILPSSNIVNFQANSTRAVVFSNGTLLIPQAQLSDSGYYKCIAINQHGVDTLVTKVSLGRRKGLIRPLRRFPARPQSASGVNTQITVPTEDRDEASGDTEVTPVGAPTSHVDPLRRRIPGGAAPGWRGIHPSRNMWRRPPVLRKPTRLRIEDRKNIVESKRKINISKSKIDPVKWADILAKIRDRKAQSTVTPLPVQYTREAEMTQQTTQLQETFEGSSDGVTVQEQESQNYTTFTHTPVHHTPLKTNKHTMHSQGMHVTSISHTEHHTRDITTISEHTHSIHTTAEPDTTQTTNNVLHTTHDMNLNLPTSSNSVFFFPQTTSAPLHTATFWQANTNTANSFSTFSLDKNHSTTNTDVDAVKTADWSKTSERRDDVDRSDVVASSNNEREPALSGSEIVALVNLDERSQEENGKYLSETSTTLQLYTQPKDTRLDDLQSQAMLTTASPTTVLVPITARGRGFDGQPAPPHSRRRNGGRRRRPNRRKQKLMKPTQYIATTPNAPLATVRVASSIQLKIDPLEVSFNTSSSQRVSSVILSQDKIIVSGHDNKTATKLPPPQASPPDINGSVLPLAKPQFKSTSEAPSFPTASPGLGHGMTSPQTVLGISDSAAPLGNFDVLTSTTEQRFSGSSPPPVQSSEETPRESLDTATRGFHTVTQIQTDVKQIQSGHQYTHTEKDEKTGMDFPLLPSTSTSAAFWIKHEMRTVSEHTSSERTTKPTVPERSYSSSPKQTTNDESEANQHGKGTADVGINVDGPMTTIAIEAHPPVTLSRPGDVIPSRVVAFSTASSPGAKMSPSWAATQEVPQIDGISDHITTSMKPSDLHPLTQPPDHNLALFITANPTSPALQLTSRHTIEQMATTTAAIQTDPFSEGLLTGPQDVLTKHQLPGQGSIPRGKPRITESNFQTLTVKAETDAQLPCVAEGEPMPFLSWTKVASGASIAQNTRVQRFEVHPNGTLVIRNTQPMDRGQYLCTVQNQYGTDKMMVDLVVLFQHPWVLQPRHRDVTVPLGGKVDLECNVEGHPVPRVTWVLSNHVHMAATSYSTAPQQRVAVLSNGTLRISEAVYTDRGVYKCIGSSTVGADTVSVRLFVSGLPPVIRQMQHENTTLSEGSTAYIHCTAVGAPQPVIRWTTPGGLQLTASQFVTGHNVLVFPNGTLYIRAFGPENAGRYECSASNNMASSRRTVMLSIGRNPSSAKASITSSSPQRTDVIYGDRLLLNCVATGEPDPWIIWRTPSKKLVDAQFSFDSRIKVFPNGTITVHSVTEKDSGDYFCVARNKMGDDYVVLRVNVLTRPAKIKQKQQQTSQEVVYGGDLKVDCIASGLPNPEISWALPDGTMVNLVKQRGGMNGGRSRRYVVFDNGTLYFNDVGMPEEGDYTCYAENQLGKDEMKVRVKVKLSVSPPQIHSDVQKIIKVFYGESVTLRCNAKGEPMPIITWISPTNRVISPALDKYQLLDDGTLMVQKVQRSDGGNYTCMARNNAGQDHKVIRLEVLVSPPTINDLRGTANMVKLTAVQDQRKWVDCVAKGTPTPRIMWVLPGNVILPAPYNSNRMAVHQNGTLEIRSLKRADSGRLSCIARNEGGEVRLVVELDVKEIRSPSADSLSLTVGNAMTLNCSIDGSTLPQVTWILPSGTPLHSGARLSKFFHQTDGSLVISNPSVAEAGMYRCLGHSSTGLVERTITLSPGRKPEINNRYSSPVSVMNGERLLLHCLTSSEPLRLTWTLPSGVVLNRPQRAGRYAVLPNGTLDIQQVSVYDRGSYVCHAANEYGSSLRSVTVIVIAYPPRITNGPPSVTYAKHGVAVQLNCIATGIPRVEVAWETPDKTRMVVSAQPRLFGNKYLHPQGSLIIQNPSQSDAGIYRCTARNAVGLDSKATILNVF